MGFVVFLGFGEGILDISANYNSHVVWGCQEVFCVLGKVTKILSKGIV